MLTKARSSELLPPLPPPPSPSPSSSLALPLSPSLFMVLMKRDERGMKPSSLFFSTGERAGLLARVLFFCFPQTLLASGEVETGLARALAHSRSVCWGQNQPDDATAREGSVLICRAAVTARRD